MLVGREGGGALAPWGVVGWSFGNSQESIFMDFEHLSRRSVEQDWGAAPALEGRTEGSTRSAFTRLRFSVEQDSGGPHQPTHHDNNDCYIPKTNFQGYRFLSQLTWEHFVDYLLLVLSFQNHSIGSILNKPVPKNGFGVNGWLPHIYPFATPIKFHTCVLR